TGDYLNTSTDLTVGDQKSGVGLGFQRYYDSGTRLSPSPMGAGWTHSYAFRAWRDSDAFAGLAATSPIDGAVAIAAAFVTFDLFNTGSNTVAGLDRTVSAFVVQRWLADQLTDNVVAVSQPGYVEHFVRLMDGTYNPPPGSAVRLDNLGDVFEY